MLNLGAELRTFVKARRLGWVVASDSGVWLERAPDTVREPRLVWVVHPDTRTVDVHSQEGAVATLGENDSLDGLDVLPGFASPVRGVFDT